MILLIETDDLTEVITDVDRISERRTPARTIIRPYKTGKTVHEGEIELNGGARITLLPEEPTG